MHETIDQVLTEYRTTAQIISVHDGDTFTALFPFPDTSRVIKWKCRIYGIDTPELMTKNSLEKECAIKAREHVKSRILDKQMEIVCKGTDKYGRVLAVLENIVDEMLDLGLCKKYSGKTKEKWTEEDYRKILKRDDET
jgi:endonuclease YncB( thermonuclease family)